MNFHSLGTNIFFFRLLNIATIAHSCPFRNPEVHQHPSKNKSLPLVSILSMVDPVCIITIHLPHNSFWIMLCTSWPHLTSFSFRTSHSNSVYAFLDCSICAIYPVHLSHLDLGFLITFRYEYIQHYVGLGLESNELLVMPLPTNNSYFLKVTHSNGVIIYIQ